MHSFFIVHVFHELVEDPWVPPVIPDELLVASSFSLRSVLALTIALSSLWH